MSEQNDSLSFAKGMVFGALLGGAIGAITALLFAPKSGAELRKDIAEKSGEVYDKAYDYFDVLKENVGQTVSSTINEGKLKAENIVSDAKRKAGEILSSAEQVMQDAKTKASHAKENVQDKIETLKDAFKAGSETFKNELKSDSQG